MTRIHDRADARGQLIRPYTVTRGRTEPARDIAVEAILTTTAKGKRTDFGSRDERRIASMCAGQALSLAEIASYTRMPLGVARVLVADMANEGLLTLHQPDPPQDHDEWMSLLEGVLDGLRKL